MKLHKCQFCDSTHEPFVNVSDDLWEVTATINCSCGAKVSISIPTDTSQMKDINEDMIKDHAIEVAILAWNSLTP